MFKKHIPNAITCCNLISGCIATYWAFQGDYHLALLFIVIGAVFDFFDGMTARLLHVSSPIGKELDSLADDITFGFAPSAIVFHFLNAQCTMHNAQCALPYLAFNALFWGSLIAGSGEWLPTLPYASWLILLSTFWSCYLLVSEIPMFALKFKTWGWEGNEIKYIFLITCIPLLLFFGISGIAIVIAWYVVLSVVAMRKK